jgi:MFS family permease
MTQVTPTTTFLSGLFGPYVLIGLGMGLAVTPIAVAGTSGVPREDAGLASGLLNTSRTVGASIGLAALATLAATRTTHVLTTTVRTPAHTATALTDGYTLAFTVAAVVLLVTAVVGQATLPSLRRISQPSEARPASQPQLDEAFETP